MVHNQITQAVRQAKASYYKEQINSTDRNPKQMWKILRKALPSNKYSSQSCNISAQAFNDFFSSVGENLTSSFGDFHLPDIMIDTPTETFSFLTVDINFVLQELLKLPKNSKLDILNFDSRLLRLASPIIAPILTHIYNLSLCSSSIPADFKKALITPIYKGKGENDNPSNYRPISVVATIAKILEKAVKVQLLTYFNYHNILSPSQSAYLKYHSTTTALHNLMDFIYSKMNESKVCIGCFLDISKGFDTLKTEILLHKLCRHGVRNESNAWFQSYLSNRNQIVNVNNKKSYVNRVHMGVPQGTVLGPLLFLVYVNDISSSIPDTFLSMYADDSSAVVNGTTVHEAVVKLNICLNKLSHWFEVNRLVINTSKSAVMIFGTKNTTRLAQNLNVTFNNNTLQQVHHTKILGIVIDENLSFKDHIEYLEKKISPKIAVIHRLRHLLPSDCLNKIYLAIIQSIFDYCLTVWGNSSKQNLMSIQRLQNRSARAVTGNFDYNSSVSNMLNDLKWMNINQRFTYFLGILVYKCLNNLAPDSLSSSLKYVSDSQPYSTRTAINKCLRTPKPDLSIMKHSFQYSGPFLWNTLPTNVTQSTTLTSFKRSLKQYVMT